MGAPDETRSHVYVVKPSRVIPAERSILSALVHPGMRALDVGCGATGRSARLLQDLGAEVVAIDVEPEAVRRLAASVATERRPRLLVADARCLPFRGQMFGLVLIALCGIDYHLDAARIQVLTECARVLVPGGYLVFSSVNPVGALITPRGLFKPRYLAWRLKQLARFSWLRPTMVDLNHLTLRQMLPHRVVRQVTANTALLARGMMSASGRLRNPALITLFARAPYYVFVAPRGAGP